MKYSVAMPPASRRNPSPVPAQSSVEAVATRFREMILAREEGAFLGSESEVTRELGVSRPTTRQAARILEREGLLRVKRGMAGGYFGVRPSYLATAGAVGAHLEALNIPPLDIATMTSAIWIEAVRIATRGGHETAKGLLVRFERKIRRLRPDTPFEEVSTVELEVRRVVMDLVDSPYMDLILQINSNFARGHFLLPTDVTSPEHQQFVVSWRDAKLVELGAIAGGNVELAALAARHLREIWDRYVSQSA